MLIEAKNMFINVDLYNNNENELFYIFPQKTNHMLKKSSLTKGGC